MKILLINTLALFCVLFSENDNQALKEDRQICKVVEISLYSDEQIKSFIIEVFGNQSDELVFNSSSRRYEMIKDFLNNRFKIEYRPEYNGKGFKLLSSLGLNNKYNNALVMDSVVEISTFNPLKYNFEMNSKEKNIYRVDNTDYIITILPTN
ncbi:hypothetical protein [Flavobacterium celericrescens]|uniref:Peptidase E n=1 Tax=Flavobacterium celericrescens TaxID=2709780 RepID=A0ABX0IB01_9FLAO|nr:hypothetical protein [Flavobacterium celericrescens]NHM04329.1 hypothetical protein [Flavobacterium celericrescens]